MGHQRTKSGARVFSRKLARARENSRIQERTLATEAQTNRGWTQIYADKVDSSVQLRETRWFFGVGSKVLALILRRMKSPQSRNLVPTAFEWTSIEAVIIRVNLRSSAVQVFPLCPLCLCGEIFCFIGSPRFFADR